MKKWMKCVHEWLLWVFDDLADTVIYLHPRKCTNMVIPCILFTGVRTRGAEGAIAPLVFRPLYKPGSGAHTLACTIDLQVCTSLMPRTLPCFQCLKGS